MEGGEDPRRWQPCASRVRLASVRNARCWRLGSPRRRKTCGVHHILSSLRKDDRVTVSGEARAIKVSTDGQPFIEVIACSIVPHHDMVEAEQEDQAVH